MPAWQDTLLLHYYQQPDIKQCCIRSAGVYYSGYILGCKAVAEQLTPAGGLTAPMPQPPLMQFIIAFVCCLY
jgi:hypothetical protein